jgi:hypothetical protein
LGVRSYAARSSMKIWFSPTAVFSRLGIASRPFDSPGEQFLVRSLFVIDPEAHQLRVCE